MSRSQTILSSLVATRQRVAEIESTDEVGAVLTLTRTSTQSITTAGTTLVWQSEIRGYEITWSGSDITIPASGWYALQISLRFSINLNNCLVVVNRNGVNVTSYNLFGDIDRSVNSVTMLEYFTEDDIVRIIVFPSANCNINIVDEESLGQSPILHIVQLSGEVDTDDV